MSQDTPPSPPGLGSSASPVVVHDGVEPMCDGQHCAVLKLGADGGLDEVIGLQVNGSCSLVQNQDATLTEQGPGKAHELPLAHTVKRKGRRLQLLGSQLSPPGLTL